MSHPSRIDLSEAMCFYGHRGLRISTKETEVELWQLARRPPPAISAGSAISAASDNAERLPSTDLSFRGVANAVVNPRVT